MLFYFTNLTHVKILSVILYERGDNIMNSNYGKLQINVFADTIGMPLENAKVKITDRDSIKTIEELKTDSSGQTQIIELPAPPPEYSLEYGNNKPYSEYNISVEAEGFENMTFQGVQIFPDSKAVENAEMKYQTNNTQQKHNILIGEHVLWGAYPAKIFESEVKPLPESYGYVVLPDIVIPEYVVVHLGSPSNKNAENVWVTYKDYIKNVASSEIYSTWPVETIKANVIAIISFTLNRVYTEWYRGKGYDFTITNNTAFDHAFNYGRNIFEEISVVVDEIFSTYLTKPDIKQPLFTQYCDGKKINCEKGMQQWGSKYLGDKGYSASDILKSYYGYDTYFETAKKVEGVPVSYGGKVLTIGSTGDDVKTIQEQLNGISDNYPKIQKLPVTGYFGEQTQADVKIFQEVFGLPITGSVDFSTWYSISNIYVSVKKISEL